MTRVGLNMRDRRRGIMGNETFPTIENLGCSDVLLAVDGKERQKIGVTRPGTGRIYFSPSSRATPHPRKWIVTLRSTLTSITKRKTYFLCGTIGCQIKSPIIRKLSQGKNRTIQSEMRGFLEPLRLYSPLSMHYRVEVPYQLCNLSLFDRLKIACNHRALNFLI